MKTLPCLLTTSTLIASTQGFQQNIPPPIRTALHLSIPKSNPCTAISATLKCNEPSNTISKLSETISYSSSLEVKALWNAEQNRRLQIRENKSGRYGGRAVSGGTLSLKDVNYEFGGKLGFDMQMASPGRYDMADVEQDETTQKGRRKQNIKKIATKVHQSSPLKKKIASDIYQSILHEGNVLEFEFDTEGNIKQSINKGNTTFDLNEENVEVKNAVPAWFPFIPTKLQIESLQTDELRYACMERNLDTSGNKNQLQDRLSGWTKEQHKRRVLERNGILQNDSDQIDDAIGVIDDDNLDGIEPLINRRKSLLRSKKPAPELEKGTLGFDLGLTRTKFDSNDKPEYLSSVAEQSSAARNRIKKSKSISSSLRRNQELSHDFVDYITEPTEEYLSGLNKAFYETQPSTANNFKVKQLYLQAKHADQSGDLERAKHLLNQLLQYTPNDSRVLRRLSRLCYEEGRVDEARNVLLSGLKSNPKDGHLLHGLGNIELNSGNLDSARKNYKEAIRATPKFPNPYHALGTLEHSLGKVRVATTVLRMGLKHCPTNHRLHHALGDLYRDAKMYDLAEKCYLTGLDCLDAESKYTGKELSWSKSFFYTALSYVSYEKHEKMECRKWLMRSIGNADNKMHSQGWLGLANLEESEGNILQAKKIYQKALHIYECHRGIDVANRNKSKSIKRPRLGDKWREVYKSYARLEEQEKNYDAVDKVYSRACHAFPDDWNMLQRWAQVQRRCGRDTRARSLFQLACERAGYRSSVPYRVYAEFEMSKKNYLRAREILFLGAQVSSDHSNDDLEGYHKYDLPLLFHSWAICEWHLGNFDRVEILFDHGLRLTDSGSKGSNIRSLILQSVARFLFHSRRDYTLAQHCVCLALSERLRPGGTSQIWYLWAKIARAMGNHALEDDCTNQARSLKGEIDEPFAFMSLLDEASTDNRYFAGNGILRQTPWRKRTLGSKVMHIQFPDELA